MDDLSDRERTRQSTGSSGTGRIWRVQALGSPVLMAAVTISLAPLYDHPVAGPWMEEFGHVLLWGNAALAVFGSAAGAALRPRRTRSRLALAALGGAASFIAYLVLTFGAWFLYLYYCWSQV